MVLDYLMEPLPQDFIDSNNQRVVFERICASLSRTCQMNLYECFGHLPQLKG
jgi:hypothetical protein